MILENLLTFTVCVHNIPGKPKQAGGGGEKENSVQAKQKGKCVLRAKDKQVNSIRECVPVCAHIRLEIQKWEEGKEREKNV